MKLEWCFGLSQELRQMKLKFTFTFYQIYAKTTMQGRRNRLLLSHGVLKPNFSLEKQKAKNVCSICEGVCFR